MRHLDAAVEMVIDEMRDDEEILDSPTCGERSAAGGAPSRSGAVVLLSFRPG